MALILGATLAVASLRVALELTGHDGDMLLTALFTALVPASITALAIVVAWMHRE